MKTLYMDIQQPGVQQILYAKQGDTYSRFFKAVLLDGGIDYSIPQGSEFSMWFSGTVPGWYDQITEKDGVTKHSAFSVNGNEVTVELAEQMMANVGTVSACLMLNTASGVQISMWSIIIEVESVPGIDSSEVSAYIEVLTGKVAETLSNANAASASANSASTSAVAASKSAADAQAVTQGQKGYFETNTALKAAHPTGQVGWWAIVGSTDTIWVWDDTTSTWLNSGNQTDLSNYYTKAQSDANYALASSVPLMQGLTATVEPISTASQAYAIGAYFVYNGLLYKCTVAIAKGGTITPGTNCTATTAGAEISTLNQNLALKTGFYYSTTAKSGVSIHYQAVSLTFAASEKTTHVTFEAPFTSACWAVFAQMSSGYTTTNPHISIANKTTTGCDFVYSANTAFTVVVDFIAIGI